MKRFGALLLKIGAVPMIPAGVGLMLFGLFRRLEHNSWEDPLSVGVSLVVMGALLWFLSRKLDSAARLVGQRRLENRILRLATERFGRLTITEAATETAPGSIRCVVVRLLYTLLRASSYLADENSQPSQAS